MARLYQKSNNTINNISSLPVGWSSREELVSLLLSDSHITQRWHDLASGVLPAESVDKSVNIIFMRHSWQLTSFGAVAMAAAAKFWTLEHSDNVFITGKILLNMGKISNSPWMSHGRHVYVWDEQIHFEIQMFDGSIRRFIEFYLLK